MRRRDAFAIGFAAAAVGLLAGCALLGPDPDDFVFRWVAPDGRFVDDDPTIQAAAKACAYEEKMGQALQLTQSSSMGIYQAGESVDDRVEREADERVASVSENGSQADRLRNEARACLRSKGIEAERVVYNRREQRIVVRGV